MKGMLSIIPVETNQNTDYPQAVHNTGKIREQKGVFELLSTCYSSFCTKNPD